MITYLSYFLRLHLEYIVCNILITNIIIINVESLYCIFVLSDYVNIKQTVFYFLND